MELRDPGNAFPEMACDKHSYYGVDRAMAERVGESLQSSLMTWKLTKVQELLRKHEP